MSRSLMLVEDDQRLGELLCSYLGQNGYTVSWESRGDRALPKILEARPDLVILDQLLPGMGGLEICQRARRSYAGPILMLTAVREEVDQVAALEAGADDYVMKPCNPRILLARIRALLRRNDPVVPEGATLVVGALSIDRASRILKVNTNVVSTTETEFEIAWELASHATTVVSRDALSRAARGVAYDGLDRGIDIHVSRLRKKLREAGLSELTIRSIRGEGYLLTQGSD